MNCPECGSYEKKEANFCSECGANLQDIIGLELYHTNNLSVAPFLRKNTLAASPLRGQNKWLVAAKGPDAQKALQEAFAQYGMSDTGKKAKGVAIYTIDVWGSDAYDFTVLVLALREAGYSSAVVTDAL